MAVAHDAASESHTGTAASQSEASFTWEHDPVGTPRGVLVFTFMIGSSAERATSVTYEGAALTAVTGGSAVDTAGEPGRCTAWFLGSSVPTADTATVVVNRTNNADAMYAVCVTVTASGDTDVTGVVLVQEDGSFAEVNVDDGTPGSDSVRYAGFYFGGNDVPAAGANSTALHSIDPGARVAGTVRETTAGQGSRPVGSTSGSDDRAGVYLAVIEVAGDQTLTGSLFTKAPTFFVGAVVGNVNLAGTLFTKAPTFFGGAVANDAAQDLTGTLFTKAPTFFAGTVAAGFVGGLPSAAVIGVWDARAHPGADTDPVASWADLGPLSQDPLAQATSGFRPLIDDSGFGGIRSILFDGVDNRLDTTLDQTYSDDFAFIVVLELVTYPTGSATVVYSTGAGTNKNILGVDDAENPPGWVVMSGPEGTQAEHHHGNVIDLEDVPVRVVMTQLVRNSGVHKLWERAVLVINESDSAQGDNLNNLGALKVGAREDDSRFMNMRLAYVLLVDMTETDEATLLLARDELGQQFAVPDMDAQAILGVLFQRAPTFFAGAVTSTRDLAGTLFTKAPTFFTGAVTATRNLAGVLFQQAPTFPTGAVTTGAVELTGSLFANAPSFFSGSLAASYALSGTLFQKSPTFPTGTVTTGAVALTGTLFQKAPTFPQGTISNVGFSAVIERGSATNLVSGTTLSASPSANITVGKIAFAFAATDNTQTTDGASTDHVSVTDTDGHTWTKVFERTRGAGGAALGATGSLWFTKVTSQISTTDSVTLTLGTARTAKALGLFEATVGAGSTIQKAAVGVAAAFQEGLIMAPSVSTSGLTSKEYLHIGTWAVEGAGAWTEDTDYTNVYAAESFRTGTTATDIAGFVAYRIATLTGDTFNASIAANRDMAAALVAFEVVTIQALTGVLFTKAPTFFTGAVTAGAVNLTGTLFQQAPTFFTGTVNAGAVNLAGVLFQNTPVFFTGQIVGAGVLTGVLFENTPVFFVGTVTQPDEPSTEWPVSSPSDWPASSTADGWPVSTVSEWQGV